MEENAKPDVGTAASERPFEFNLAPMGVLAGLLFTNASGYSGIGAAPVKIVAVSLLSPLLFGFVGLACDVAGHCSAPPTDRTEAQKKDRQRRWGIYFVVLVFTLLFWIASVSERVKNRDIFKIQPNLGFDHGPRP